MCNSPRLSCLLALPALALLTLSGCGINATLTGPTSTTSQTQISGSLHGGQQPIAFATVQLWSAGSSGYGSQGQLFATMQTVDNGQGSFAFTKQPNTDTPYPSAGSTWACPASSDPYMYLVAKGGNTQGTHLSSQQNSAAAFLLAIGKCSTISQSSFYFLNEVTTAGSLAALTQFFSPATETVGAPASTLAQQGLANAFALVPTLINISAGTPQGRLTWTYSYTLPDVGKINTLADIVAACINTPAASSSVCQTLFSNATPPSPALTSQPSSTFATATDTLGALWYMFTNPTNGSATQQANLFGLVSAAAPFQPTLSAQPTDWTVTLTASNTPRAQSTDPFFLNMPTQVVIGPHGSIVFSDNNPGNAEIAALAPTGGFLSAIGGGLTFTTAFVAFDKRANLWLASSDGSLNEYINFENPYNFGGLKWLTYQSPQLVTPLPNGDTFWISTQGDVSRITSASIDAVQQSTLPAYEQKDPTSYVTGFGMHVNTAIADPLGNIWAAAADGNLYELTAASGYSPVLAAPIGTDVTAYTLAIDASGGVLLPLHSTGPNPQVLRVSGSPSAGYTTTTLPGTASSLSIAVDGAGNIWQAPSSTETLNGVVSGFITAMTSSGTSLLGASGIARPATSTTTSTTLVQNVPVLGPAAGLAIDLAGDVWVSNTGTNLFNTTDGPQYSVTELVGAAVPVTPPSVGLFNNTLAQKP